MNVFMDPTPVSARKLSESEMVEEMGGIIPVMTNLGLVVIAAIAIKYA